MTIAFNGLPRDLLSYPGASPKLLRGPGGSQSVIRYQAHNLVAASEDFTRAEWAKTSATVTANTITDTDTGAFAFVSQSAAAVSGATYEIRWRVQKDSVPASTRFPRFQINSGTIRECVIDTSTGVVRNIPTGTFDTLSAVDGGTFWEIVATFVAGAASIGVQIVAAVGSVSNIATATNANYSATPTGSVTILRTHLRRTPSDDTYLATTSAPRFAMPLEFGPGMTTGTGTQTITVIPGAKYTVQPTGTGSVTLSGAATGTVAGGTRRTIRAATSSLTLTVSGTLTGLEVYRNRGARIEPQATNLFLQNRFTGGANGSPGTPPTGWTQPIGTGTCSYATSSLGPWIATTQSVTSAERPFLAQSVSVVSGTTYAIGIFVEAFTGTIPWSSFVLDNIGGTFTYPSTNVTGTGRFTVLYTATTTGSVQFRIGLGTGGGLGVAASITFSLPQIETGSTATSPIETYGSTVTRAADNPSLATSAFPWSATQVSFAIVYALDSINSGGASRILVMDAGSTNSSIIVDQTAPTTGRVYSLEGGLQTLNNLTIPALPQVTRISAAYELNNVAASGNGGAVVTDTSAVHPVGITHIRLGNGPDGINPMAGYIESVLIVPRRVSNADLPNLGA